MKEKKFMYQIIKDYILELINTQNSYNDIKLPSENQLALKFNVSRLTAKNAILALQEGGLVYRIHGKGTFAYGTKHSASNPAIKKVSMNCLLLPNFSSTFISEIIEGCSDYFSRHGQRLYICWARTQEEENEAIENAFQLGTTGFIVFPANSNVHNKRLFKLALENFPVVFIDRSLNGFDISCVSTDHIVSAYDATKYLYTKGCKNIGFISYAPVVASSIQDRITGYEKALGTLGLPLTDKYKLFVQEGYRCLSEIKSFLIKNPELDGIISCGDDIGLELYRAALELKIPVPEKLSFILYDSEYTKYQDLLPYRPTVIAQQAYAIGHEAAHNLHLLLDTPENPRQNVLLPSKIIIGDSTKA